MVYSLSIITASYSYEMSIPCRKFSILLVKLARNLIYNKCAKVLKIIHQIVTSPDFTARHRQHQEDFTRKRKIPFHVLIVFLINFIRGLYKDELDGFFKTICRFDVARRMVSKAAFAKARMKIKFQAFVELNIHLVNLFEKHFTAGTWFGFRLLAIDGSTSPMARVSQLFDVLNKIRVAAIIKPKSFGERELAAQHLLNVMPTDLILLDRGYPACWLFSSILSMNANFCARVSCTKWKTVRKLFRSGRAEKIIELPPFATTVVQCRQMGLDMAPLKLRLIRIENHGNVAVLITSLIYTKKHHIYNFNDLYHHRWPIEICHDNCIYKRDFYLISSDTSFPLCSSGFSFFQDMDMFGPGPRLFYH